jgi:hypothetical protein
VVFQGRLLSHLHYTSQVISQSRTRVKLFTLVLKMFLIDSSDVVVFSSDLV